MKNALLTLAVLLTVSLASQSTFAKECKKDDDCDAAKKEVCILAMTPPQCKPPQDKGAACKRDKVCKSGKCDIPAGKDAGVCK